MANNKKVLGYEVEIQKPGGGVFFNFDKIEDAVIFASASIKITHIQNIIVYRCDEITDPDPQRLRCSRTQIFNLKE